MKTVEIPAELAEKLLRVANEFGEPSFSVVVGEGESGLAERLKDLLNLITSDFAERLPQDLRARATKGR